MIELDFSNCSVSFVICLLAVTFLLRFQFMIKLLYMFCFLYNMVHASAFCMTFVLQVVNAYLSILQKENNISTKGHIFVFPSYLAELWGRQNCKEQELLSVSGRGGGGGFSNFVCLFVLRLYVPVNNFSVMSGRSQRFLGLTSTVGS